MIDIADEKLVTLAEAAKLLPDCPSAATLWRWRTKGARGRRLESITLGGKVYTSVEAIQRFCHQQGGATEELVVRSPRQRERAIAAAEAELCIAA